MIPCTSTLCPVAVFFTGYRNKLVWGFGGTYAISNGVYNAWMAVLTLNLTPLGITQSDAGYIGFVSFTTGMVATLIVGVYVLMAHCVAMLLLLLLLLLFTFFIFFLFHLIYAIIFFFLIPSTSLCQLCGDVCQEDEGVSHLPVQCGGGLHDCVLLSVLPNYTQVYW